jgi:transcriptional regulator with XRE-family HTH domain
MGRASRRKPARLAEKLLHIRTAMGLSQNELIGRMGLTGELFQDSISAFERGVREPDLLVLLEYARVAGVFIDALVDDSIDLPMKLPASQSYQWSVARLKRQ